MFWNYFNQLTGVFAFFVFFGDRVWMVGDPSGMKTIFFGLHDHKFYASSHTKLLDDLLKLNKDPYINRLINYKYFPLLGNSLPGDLTQFRDIKRVTPNHCYVYEKDLVSKFRFFTPYNIQGKTDKELAQEAGQILHSSLEMVTKKWKKPAISLTGGCDSKTTLACAAGLYDKFQYFSYYSSEAEKVDCLAASEICDHLHLKHSIYEVPLSKSESSEYETVKRIIRSNCGDILDPNENDVYKRIYLDKVTNYDVEVKSWASEIGRAYYSKRFNGRTRFPKEPTGRQCTTLYKFFLFDRKLVKQTDLVFEEFIKEYYQTDQVSPIPWFDQFFWEFRVPAWNGLVITGEHSYTSDIDIPYNNRMLLTILLSVSLKDRINDSLYTEIRRIMNPMVDETGVSVTNLHHTKVRAIFENLYYVINSSVPF